MENNVTSSGAEPRNPNRNRTSSASDWLADIETLFSRLSDSVSQKDQYAYLETALNELDREGDFGPLFGEQAQKYIDCAQEAFKASRLFFANNRRLVSILKRARGLAVDLGDKRSTAILDLILSVTFLSLNKAVEATRVCERGVSATIELGDEDFTEYTRRFLILHHTLRGEPLQALEAYMNIQYSLDADSDPFVIGHIIPLTAINAAFVGQFRLGRRLLTNALRIARAKGFTVVEKHLEPNLGLLYLFVGDRVRARQHITAVSEISEELNVPIIRFWVLRSKALLLLEEGDSKGAFKQLIRAKSIAGKHHLMTGLGIMPWLVQMLWSFHRAGHESFPGFDYSREAQRIMKGSNRYMKGVIYRLMALEMDQDGGSIDSRLDLLLKSAKELAQVSGQVDLAKTWIELTKVYLKKGDSDSAGVMINKAWQVLKTSAPLLFPQELNYLLDDSAYRLDQKSIGDAYTRLVETVSRMSVAKTRQELIQRMVSLSCLYFGAEKAEFYIQDKSRSQSVVLEASFDFTNFRTDVASHTPVPDIVGQTLQTGQPMPDDFSQSDRPCQSFTIPVFIFNIKGVLRLEASDGIDIFYEFPVDQVIQLSRQAGQLFSILLNMVSVMEDTRRNSLIQATTGRLSENDKLQFKSDTMRQVVDLATLASQSDVSVVINGETGVGKELLVKHIHQQSHRSHMPFVTVDLTTLPELLIESELFGHEKGAFTGAVKQKVGQVELADKGTLFIDEIGDAPLSVQLKLLRVLQEGCFRRVGGTKVLHANFRLIAATNKDLMAAVHRGDFREDLYYRLNVISIQIPPLRDREDDIVYLAQYFLERFQKKHGKSAPALDETQKSILKSHNWPGNVRELKNVMERVVVLQDVSPIHAYCHDLSSVLPPKDNRLDSKELVIQSVSSAWDTNSLPTLDDVQTAYIQRVLELTAGSKKGIKGAADILGLNRSTLYYRMSKLGIKR